MAPWQDAAATPPEWLVGPTAAMVSLLVLFYIVMNLAILAIGVDKVEAWRVQTQARLEQEHPWLFVQPKADANADASAPAAPELEASKKRKKRGARSKRSRWSFFLGGPEEERQDADAGPFDLDDESWCVAMNAHEAQQDPADHHFIGEATPVVAQQQDVYELADDVWCLSQV